MEPTSFDAYYSLIARGQLGKSQRQVLVALLTAGPQTGRELNARLGVPDAHKRLSELEDKGLVFPSGTTVCPITHRRSKVWSVSAQSIPSNRTISTDPEHARRKRGIRDVQHVKTGDIIFAAMADGLPLMASASKTKVFEYCQKTGCDMVRFRPEVIWKFYKP